MRLGYNCIQVVSLAYPRCVGTFFFLKKKNEWYIHARYLVQYISNKGIKIKMKYMCALVTTI